jgi:hypothetical protein
MLQIAGSRSDSKAREASRHYASIYRAMFLGLKAVTFIASPPRRSVKREFGLRNRSVYFTEIQKRAVFLARNC